MKGNAIGGDGTDRVEMAVDELRICYVNTSTRVNCLTRHNEMKRVTFHRCKFQVF